TLRLGTGLERHLRTQRVLQEHVGGRRRGGCGTFLRGGRVGLCKDCSRRRDRQDEGQGGTYLHHQLLLESSGVLRATRRPCEGVVTRVAPRARSVQGGCQREGA